MCFCIGRHVPQRLNGRVLKSSSGEVDGNLAGNVLDQASILKLLASSVVLM